MPKYLVQNTNILRNGKKYPEGSEIELSEKEAAVINPLYLKLTTAPETGDKTKDGPKDEQKDEQKDKQEDKPEVNITVAKGPVNSIHDRKKPLAAIKDPKASPKG